ncbi:MAG: UDP-N-acetylglucosamine 2-epimerase, partial [Gammaproteobacteria bacterium]
RFRLWRHPRGSRQSLGKPLLTLRAKTERPEAVETGTTKLITNAEQLTIELQAAHASPPLPKSRSRENPFGDGNSGPRIAEAIDNFLTGPSA